MTPDAQLDRIYGGPECAPRSDAPFAVARSRNFALSWGHGSCIRLSVAHPLRPAAEKCEVVRQIHVADKA